MTQSFLALWSLSIIAKPILAGVIAWRRLPFRYPAFFLYLLYTAAVSIQRLPAAKLGLATYKVVWLHSQAFSIAAITIVTIEACVRMMAHFGSKYWASSLLFCGIFAGLSLAVVSAVAVRGIGWPDGAVQMLLLAGRNWSLGCFLALIATRTWMWTARRAAGLTLSTNVNRHSRILTFLLASKWIVDGLHVATPDGHWMVVVIQYLAVGLPLVCYCVWGLALTQPGEKDAVLGLRVTPEQRAVIQQREQQITEAALKAARRRLRWWK